MCVADFYSKDALFVTNIKQYMETDVSKVSRLEVIGQTREYVNMDT